LRQAAAVSNALGYLEGLGRQNLKGKMGIERFDSLRGGICVRLEVLNRWFSVFKESTLASVIIEGPFFGVKLC